jgi:hypothetical protein
MRTRAALGRAVLLAVALCCCSAELRAEPADRCAVPGYMLFGDNALDRVHAAVSKDKALKIIVLGGTSSFLPGPDGPSFSYPERLHVALRARLPDVRVTVVSKLMQRKTAAEMAGAIEQQIVDEKPNLVIWQTGTYDAIRGTETEEFRAALSDGVEKMHKGGADVVLVNMQYSPRTDSIMSTNAYADGIRWVARELEVPVFDRHAIMRSWYESGQFDLYAATKDLTVPKGVHDCIGRALGDLIVDAAHLEAHDGNAPK